MKKTLIITLFALVISVVLSGTALAGENVSELPEAAVQHMKKATVYLEQINKSLPKDEQKKLAAKALSQMRAAYTIAPESTKISYTLATFYYQLGQFNQATKVLKKLVKRLTKVKPENGKEINVVTNALETLAYSLAKLGKFKESEEYFREILVLKPDDLRTLKNLFRLFYALKKRDKIIEVGPKIIAQKFDEDTALQLGLAYKLKKKFAKAVKVFEKVLEKNAKSREALMCLADCWYGLKDYDSAIETAEKFIELHPKAKGVRKVKKNLRSYKKKKRAEEKKKKRKKRRGK